METMTEEKLEEMYHDQPGTHSPMRARRRQSDAKWRASVATCYDTLKHVVPKGHSFSKRKVSKAVILQESERHILKLESVLSRLIGSESHSSGKAVLWKEDNQWSRCNLQHFQQDFAEKQHKIFHSSNQGRRCYNLLDEIKEEIFTMSVDPESVCVVDQECVSASKCKDKVSGKDISLFSQMPFHCVKKEMLTTVKTSISSETIHHRNRNSLNSCPDENFVASKTLAQYVDMEEQTVPNWSPSHRHGPDNAHQSSLSSPLFSSPLMMCDISKRFMNKSEHCNTSLDRDQEVPSLDSNCSGEDYMPSEGTAVDFLGKLSRYIKSMDSSTEPRGKMDTHSKFETQTPGSATRLFQSKGKTASSENEGMKTPGNTAKVKDKCLQICTMMKPFQDKGGKKSATARKLNFNRAEFAGTHQKLQEQRDLCQDSCNSPMLACFTPVKLSSNVTYCITCKHPDETLVSPWKPFNSPIHGVMKKKDTPPVIDPENSLFCFESMDSILNKDDGEDERTPAVHSNAEDSGQTNQPFKRKISGKGIDVQDKCQPKCRKKLERFYDKSIMGPGNMCHWNAPMCVSEEAQVVPDQRRVLTPLREDDGEGRGDMDQALCQHHNEDTTDFDGFFFYFRQIGQQLKQQKLSKKEIQSTPVAAKVLKMWMRLPSPDKQTIKTLAMLESQGLCPSLQVKVGGLSQDLQDVDLVPIDLKEFIPTTPV